MFNRGGIHTLRLRLTLVRQAVCSLIFVCTLGVSFTPLFATDDLFNRREKLSADFAQRLERLGERCEQLGLEKQAKITRAWKIRRDRRRQYLFLLPEPNLPAGKPTETSTLLGPWWRDFTKIRAEYASEVFKLAQQALAAHRPALAYQLVYEVLREDPQHQAARKILGHQKTGGHWHTSFAARKLRSRQVWHSKYGYLPRGFVKRYDSGQRRLRNRWGTIAEEEQLRGGQIENGWQVETAHYEITTNHSLEAGVQLGQRLEELHSVWRQLFVSYWTSEAELSLRFRGRRFAKKAPRKHQVILFRNRQEYVSYLEKSEPQIDITLGIYLDRRRTAYFYAGDKQAETTWFHEATHQLFHETRPVSTQVGGNANFWIIEGIALYLESLVRHSAYYTVGGVAADRLQYARYRALAEGFYIPLNEFVGLSREQLQTDERIRRLYSQAAGLTHFLADYDQGRYRHALADYLLAVYQGQDDRQTLAKLCGVGYQQLDDEYRRFLQVEDADLAFLDSLPQTTKLSLGNTAITDQGLSHLANLKQLEWLDLSATDVSDQGITQLENALRLQQLSLDRTRISDVSLPLLGRFVELRELDLSGTEITDQGLKHLSNLQHLHSLWLSGTRLTDVGLQHLAKLKNLKTLDVQATHVSPQGVQRLQQTLPKLEITQ